jgi:lipopolysaccharide/colanic/teichoic acid biosynthesis glycosyltransferase
MSTAPPQKTQPPRPGPRPALTRRTPAPHFAPVSPVPTRTRRIERGKAVVDYPLAAIMFLALLPVILMAMLAVKLTSRGPALYTQTRVGRGGRVFTIYKVRTMYHECESLTGPRWSMPGDPRVTPVGKLFRALHIDELPQLWNVLKGDMSLVGPRPERPEICRQLRQVIPGYDRRHAVKPGITGFAQVHLPPDSCLRSVRNKVAYDRFYILRMSARMELYVFACTALKLLGLRGLFRRPPRKPAE